VAESVTCYADAVRENLSRDANRVADQEDRMEPGGQRRDPMEPRMIAVIGTAIFLAGAAAAREGKTDEDDERARGSSAPSAMVNGGLGCEG
jgi:hypothetical protein